MLVPARIAIDRERLAEFCRLNGIRKLSLFGSVLRDDFRPQSDVDVLVEFEPGAPIGYLDMARMELELADLLGRRVDLRTLAELSRYFRREVADSAEGLYPTETQATTAPPIQDGIRRALALAGAWSDLDWDETLEELDRIRHQTPGTSELS
jgi:predicted nucleotidyltransferase